MEGKVTSLLLGASAGLVVSGFPGLVAGVGLVLALPRIRRRRPGQPSSRLVLLLLIVELRSGLSVLAALQEVSAALPGHHDLRRVARVATVSGLTTAIPHAGPSLRPVIAQLARAQRSGASLDSAARRMLEQDLARERSARLARARSLPVRLMLPVTLLMLPGLVLLLYAPALLRLLDDITGAFT